MGDALAPVVVFAYNRPDHLQRTLDALAACRLAAQSTVHVYADGPRKPEAADAVAAVREALAREATAGRFAALHVHASPVNLGLANSIIRGVGQVLAEHDHVIVLEDDLLVAPDFLAFMNDCLRYYEHDPAVGAVTGFSPLATLPAGCTGDVYLCRRTCSNGWGTWSDVWERVDWRASGIDGLNRSWPMRRAFNREGNDRYDRLRRQLAGRIDSWSIRFGLSLFLRGLGTVYPSVNRVANIGFDGTGVHCGTGVAMNDHVAESAYTLRPLEIDPRIQRAFARVYGGSVRGRLQRGLLAAFPRVAGWMGR